MGKKYRHAHTAMIFPRAYLWRVSYIGPHGEAYTLVRAHSPDQAGAIFYGYPNSDKCTVTSISRFQESEPSNG